MDSHALLWWLIDDPALPAAARKFIRARSDTILVSAASAWEIATKFRIGKLPEGPEFAPHFDTVLVQELFESLPIEQRPCPVCRPSDRNPHLRCTPGAAKRNGRILLVADLQLPCDQQVRFAS